MKSGRPEYPHEVHKRHLPPTRPAHAGTDGGSRLWVASTGVTNVPAGRDQGSLSAGLSQTMPGNEDSALQSDRGKTGCPSCNSGTLAHAGGTAFRQGCGTLQRHATHARLAAGRAGTLPGSGAVQTQPPRGRPAGYGVRLRQVRSFPAQAVVEPAARTGAQGGLPVHRCRHGHRKQTVITPSRGDP